MIGQTIGSYKIIDKIGEGGMGAVYRGEHTLLGRAAAIKVLLSELSQDANIVKRFFNEARAATAIKHPGIVEVFDFGNHTDGSAFIVMELLQGEPLSAMLHRETKLPHEKAVGVITQIAAALGAAHAEGIVHRDLKPDNIFMVPDSLIASGLRVKLLDFGIAKLAGELRGELEATRAGAVLGTPPYMAPEQCVGSPDVDHRADMYAVGCLLFHLLCGRPPFISEGFGQITVEHMTAHPPKPSGFVSSIPPELDAIVYRLLEKKPDDRFQSAGQLIAALEGKPERAATPVPKSVNAAKSAPADAPTKIELAGSGPVPNAPEPAPTVRGPDDAEDPEAVPTIRDAKGQDSRKTVAMTAPALEGTDSDEPVEGNDASAREPSPQEDDDDVVSNTAPAHAANPAARSLLPTLPLIVIATLAVVGIWLAFLR